MGRIRNQENMKKKICLIASSGGHYEQILMLERLEKYFDIYYVTEKTKYLDRREKTYYINQVNRKEKLFILRFAVIFFQSIKIFFKEKPDIIISTGALSVIPTFIIGKLFKKELIFIESFAKITSPTMTGKLIYRFADKFIVQWEDMLDIYPKAVYLGSIY